VQSGLSEVLRDITSVDRRGKETVTLSWGPAWGLFSGVSNDTQIGNSGIRLTSRKPYEHNAEHKAPLAIQVMPLCCWNCIHTCMNTTCLCMC
jgi:hypothetical protein